MDHSTSNQTKLRLLAREWVPSGIRSIGNRLLGASIRYRGPYADWSRAMSATMGYQNDGILARVRHATQQVLHGEADYEQDGLVMHGPLPASHALAALLLIASRDSGRLSVLDFGGGLGSHFLRWRAWLKHVPDLHWNVVEQPHFVRAGNELFIDETHISFVSAIASAHVLGPNVVHASSVLQYLENPLHSLEALIATDPKLFVLDRTPYSCDGMGHILSQNVPKQLGSASYPLWMLAHEAVHLRLRERYELLAEYPSGDASIRSGRLRGEYLGSIWMRRD